MVDFVAVTDMIHEFPWYCVGEPRWLVFVVAGTSSCYEPVVVRAHTYSMCICEENVLFDPQMH